MKKMCAICRKAKEEEEFRIKRQKINEKSIHTGTLTAANVKGGT